MQTTEQAVRRLVTARRLCFLLAVSRTTLWRLSRSHGFPKPVRLGARSIRFDWGEVDSWAQSRKAK